MEVKSLFDKAVYDEMMERINHLSTDSPRQWGKMSAAQMLAHCRQAFKVPLSEKPIPRMLIGRILGWMVKSKLYGSKPYARNLPTSPDFIIKDQRDFDQEKSELVNLVTQFHQKGPDQVGNYPHPFFGTFSKEQWGKSMWKHLDHHLRQFGV
ncbi:MAG TPA: DUF1569 domain-containing protein [Chitinophagaceae bacterium]|nr:DUF1569 domain-containing protein [Chitinophagaceae bacterium]